MIRIVCLLLTFLICFSNVVAQNQFDVDNINSISERFRDFNADSTAFYAQKAFDLSKEMVYEKGQVEALTNLCFSCYVKGDYAKGIAMCQEGIDIAQNAQKPIDISMLNQFLGLIYINQGKYPEAIEVLLPIIEVATKNENLFLLADVCGNLGLSYLNQHDYQKAFKFLNTAKNIHGQIYHPHSKVWVGLNLGRLYFELEQFDSAYHYLDESAKFGFTLNNPRAVLHSYALLAQICINQQKTDQAELYLDNAGLIADSLNLSWEKANIASLQTELYYNKNEFEEAIQTGKKAIDLGKKIEAIYIIQKANNLVAKSYLQLNKINDAEEHVIDNETFYDSLLSDTLTFYSTVVNANNLMRDAQDFNLIKKELKAAKAEIDKRNIVLYGTSLTIVMVIIILILIIKSNKNKSKNYKELQALNEVIQDQKNHLERTNQDLDMLNKEKDLLLGMVAHDIRSPLNKISGLINIIKLEKGFSKEHEEISEIVQKTIKEANLLVNELLEINKLEAGVFEVQKETFDLVDFLSDLLFFYENEAKAKEIKINLEAKRIANHIVTDKKLLKRIIDNLVTNAIKFSERKSVISLTVEEIENEFLIKVKDNGLGIPREEHKLLFSKFGKTSTLPTAGEASNGLGLYIVDQLTNVLQGSITFESTEGIGSEFTVHLPIM